METIGLAEIIKTYAVAGAEVIAICIVFAGFVYMLLKVYPQLSSMKEVAKNNTQAMMEMSKSNNNVASALNILDSTMKSFCSIMEEHDKRQIEMNQTLAVVDGRVKDLVDKKK